MHSIERWSEMVPTSRNPISRWSVSTASCRRWRPQGSGEDGGDLGLGAAIAIIEIERRTDIGALRSCKYGVGGGRGGS
jgi:hypothetical protein